MYKNWLCATAATLAILPVSTATAGVIDSWNQDNVVVAPGPYLPEVTYFTNVYNKDVTGGTAGATTNGTISFELPKSDAPGIKVENSTEHCIIASGQSSCDGPFQSGKRFKEQIRGQGAIDLVFDVSESPEVTNYRVYQKLANITGGQLDGFTLELGFGLGDDFVASTDGDGLGFNLGVDFEPSTNFSFGMFGDADTNHNHTIDGFFDPTGRAGFNVAITEDMINSLDMYGNYESIFGAWLGKTIVPEGYFWDHDNDDTTDAILMAYLDENGDWIQQRIDVAGVPTSSAPTVVTEQSLIDANYDKSLIDDLGNLNVNYHLMVGDITGWGTYQQGLASNFGTANFTLRLTPNAVPEPAGAALLGVSLALLGWRRRKSA